MSGRVSLRLLIRSYAGWVVLLGLPLALNVVMWRTLVVSQQRQLEAWQGEQRLSELKPKLTALLAESRGMVNELERTRVTRDDPSVVMQVLQRLAERHRVQIKELSAQGQRSETPASGASSVPLDLQVTGRFTKLAHWMSDLEAQPDVQIDSWTLEPSKDLDVPHQLTVHLTAFLGEAS